MSTPCGRSTGVLKNVYFTAFCLYNVLSTYNILVVKVDTQLAAICIAHVVPGSHGDSISTYISMGSSICNSSKCLKRGGFYSYTNTIISLALYDELMKISLQKKRNKK